MQQNSTNILNVQLQHSRLLEDIDNIQVSTSYVRESEECCYFLSEARKSFNKITQNICSISVNLPIFLTQLSRTKLSQDIIVLTECWLSCNPNIPALEGYNRFHSMNRINKSDGSVSYIRSIISRYHVFELKLQDANYVAVVTCILGIYRPPCFRNVANIPESLGSFLTSNSTYKKLVLIIYIYIDINESSTNSNAKEHLNIIASHGLWPAHTHI